MAKSREQYIAERSDDYDTDLATFSLVDEKTVKRLVDDGDIELPYKDLDKIKDKRWNTKQMSSKLLQGILNGDPVDKIAQSLIGIVSNNEAAAMRNARTMVTGAENRGRLDSYNELDEQGVVQKKKWIATPDDRTRESHLEIDGEEVDIGDKFTNGLDFPGDPSGDPSEVYNCRCTMVDRIVGFRRADGSISYIDAERDSTTHDKQIDEERERRGIEEPETTQEPVISFTPAATIEEAERFAREAFISGGFNLTGKDISYKGVDIDVANRINKRLNEIYAQYNINDLSSLEAYGKGNKKVFARNPDAPFFTTNFGNIGMNTTLMKNEAMIKAYQTEGENAFKYVIDNMGVLSGKQFEVAKAYELAGRSLVDNSLEGMITHEIGHQLSYMPEINKALSAVQGTD